MTPGMLLAIDTATAACSAALIEADGTSRVITEIVGRGHAERLMPMVDTLFADAGGGRPEAILIDCGPGSFTGVRVGLAAAIGLGIGWDIPVHGFSSTALLAAMLFARRPGCDRCAVALAGGHGELFIQRFAARPFTKLSDLASLPPIVAAARTPEEIVVGSGAAALIAARGFGEAVELLPDAAGVTLLPPAFRDLAPRPIYGRAPDARPAAA